MSERSERSKRVIRIAIVAGGILAAAMVLFLIGAVLGTAGQGADPASALNRASEVPQNIGDIVSWARDPELVRVVEPQTRLLVESAWVRAWHRVSVAQLSGERAGVDTWFLGQLSERVAASVGGPEFLGEPEAGPIAVGGVVQHGHQAQVSFYSLDGSVMTLDVVSDLERLLGPGESVRASETFEVVMVLSDGNWRLQHLTRTDIAEQPASS